MKYFTQILESLIFDYYHNVISEEIEYELLKDRKYSNKTDFKSVFKDDLLFYMYMHLTYMYEFDCPMEMFIWDKSSDLGRLLKYSEELEKQLTLKNSLFMKAFSYHVCKAVMHTLIEINKSATTLEVKNILRSMGYVATQEHVSETMDAICGGTQSPYTYMGNGKFRIYTFLNLNSKGVTVPVTQTSTISNKKVKVEPKKTKVTKKTKTRVETLYVVFEKDSNGKELNFKSYYAENRDIARKKYSKNMGVQYYRVRARLHGAPATTTK